MSHVRPHNTDLHPIDAKNTSNMWEQIQNLLSSKSSWSAVFYLIVGAILGALVSIYFTVRTQKPRLIIGGGGSGSNQQGQRWTISITNRPTFLGVPFAGETARDLHAWLRLKQRESSNYPLFWTTPRQPLLVTIEPGQSQSLDLFSWTSDRRGSYCVLDQSGEPVAKFDTPKLDFVLLLNDRLGRMTEFAFAVKFDDSHLKNLPQLQIVYPLSLEMRTRMVKDALRQVLRAFGWRT